MNPDPPAGAPYDWSEPVAVASRPLKSTLIAGGLTVVALAVAGGPLGLLWHLVAPTPALRADLKMILGPSAVL